MKKGVLLTFIAIFIPWFLQAQTTPNSSLSLSLEEAVENAMKYNKQLQASQMDIEIRKKMIMETISKGLPQINGSLNYSTNFKYEMEFGGNIITMKDQSNFGLSVSQLIFSGEWIVGIQSSNIAKQMVMLQQNANELDVKETVYNSYFTILVSERLMEIIKENLKNMDNILKHTENLYKAGVVEITDVEQIKITVGQLKNSLLSMERAIDVNYNLLRLQLGISAGTPLTLTDALDHFLVDQNSLKLANQSFDIQSNVQYQLMQSQEEVQQKMVKLKKWAYAPTISANYNFTHKILKPALDMSPKHSATITMNIPVFSGLQRKSQLDQEKIILEQTQLNKSLLEDQLYLQEEQYKFALRNAIENYNLQKENIQVAKNMLNSYQRKYNAGSISSLDLTQANNNYLNAENNYASACLALLQAKIQLEKLHNTLK